ncbi:alpha/beta fold hydrolase, partial [Streptosporangium sandarakinum]
IDRRPHGRSQPHQHPGRDARVQGWAELIAAKTWDTPGDHGQYLACIDWMLDVDHAARWPRITQPVLVLALEHDLLFPP